MLIYFLTCDKGHEIPIPRPNLVGKDGSLLATDTDTQKELFLCPHCGLLSAYSRLDIESRADQPHKPDLSKPVFVLVAAEGQCDGENCEAPKTIHILAEASTGAWKGSIAAKDWTISDTALCGNGHKLRPPEPMESFRPREIECPF